MRIFSVALLGLAVAACTPNDVTFGGAVRHNVAMQTIDPEPRYKGTDMEGGSGTHAASAMERYRKSEVKEPQTIKTTEGATGSGGGSN